MIFCAVFSNPIHRKRFFLHVSCFCNKFNFSVTYLVRKNELRWKGEERERERGKETLIDRCSEAALICREGSIPQEKRKRMWIESDDVKTRDVGIICIEGR